MCLVIDVIFMSLYQSVIYYMRSLCLNSEKLFTMYDCII